MLLLILFISMFDGCKNAGENERAEMRTIRGNYTYSSVIIPDALGNGLMEHIAKLNDKVYYSKGQHIYAYDLATKKHKEILDFLPSKNAALMSMAAGENRIWLIEKSSAHLYHRAIEDNGSEEALFDISFIYGGGADYTVYSMRVDKDENISLLLNNQIITLDNKGTEICRIESNGTITGILSDASHTIRAIAIEGNSIYVYDINIEKEKLENPIVLPQGTDNWFDGNGNYDLFYKDKDKLFGLKMDSRESVELLEWAACDIDASYVPLMIPIYENDFFCIMDRPSFSENLTFHLTTEEVVKTEKITLTMAVFNPGHWLMSAVSEFNLSSAEYRIEVINYPSTNSGYTFGHIDNEQQTKFITEMTAGNIPDIIDVSVLPVECYAKKGMFEDLYPYIDADPELSREDILPNILQAIEIDGHLYHTLSDFYIETVMGRSGILGNDIGWTLDEFLQTDADNQCFYASREMLLEYFSVIYAEEFIDWEHGTCGFDNEKFIRLLNILKSQISEEKIDAAWLDMGSAFRNGEYLLYPYVIVNPLALQNFQYLFDEDYVFKGYPLEKGGGNFIRSNYSPQLAISKASVHKEAAWSFVRTMFTEEYQTLHNILYMPTNKASMDKYMKSYMTPEYEIDSYGNEVEIPKAVFSAYDAYGDSSNTNFINAYAVSQEDYVKFMELLNSSNRLYRPDIAVFNMIKEACSAFFADDKTAEETARIIQARIGIYVSEQS
jgi:ABC-type glycerol-3-phosphate transport system substrate-binding protein